MSDADPLAALRQQLAALDDAPLSHHPGVLEAVHRELVSELEALEGLDHGADEEESAH